MPETTDTQTIRTKAAEALACVFADAERSVLAEGIAPGEAIRRHVAAVKAERPEVYDLIVRNAARQLVETLRTVDWEQS